MIPLLCVLGALLALWLLSRIAWGRSLTATVVAFASRVIPLRARFKADEAGTRARLARSREERYELPKGFARSKSVKELLYEGMRVFCLNEGAKSNLVMVYVHGGGFVEEITLLHWNYLADMARRTDAKILVPLYPLAPFHTYKDAFPAIIDLYRDIAADNPGKRMILSGDSAGGCIALAIAEELTKEEQPVELILLSPAVYAPVDPKDRAETDCFRKCTLVGVDALNVLAEAWAGGKEALSLPCVSPYFGDVSGLKKVTILTGERDMAYAMSLKLDKKLRDTGVDVKTIVGRGMNHVWPVYPIPEARRAKRQIAEIIKGGS